MDHAINSKYSGITDGASAEDISQRALTLFKTLLTSLANSLEQTSRWNIFPQFETQAPRSCKDMVANVSSDSESDCLINTDTRQICSTL